MQLHMDNSPDFSWLSRVIFTQCYLKAAWSGHWDLPSLTVTRTSISETSPGLTVLGLVQVILTNASPEKIKSRKKYPRVSASLSNKMLKYCTPLQPRVSPVLTSDGVTAKLRPSTFSWQMTFSWLKLWYVYSWAPENKPRLIKICKGHEHTVPVGVFFEQSFFFLLKNGSKSYSGNTLWKAGH